VAAQVSRPVKEEEEERTVTVVDPFLVEALENPRHRLTFLRMELDIQKFMQNSGQHQFEFQYLPTSYLRCAAHRVAQHYGLQTMALDNAVDGFGSRVVARKVPESRYPAVCLSDIPMKQAESEKPEPVKIVIRPRPNQASSGDAMETGAGRPLLRTVEERKEEYDKARARIFSAPSSPEAEVPSSMDTADGRNLCLNRGEQQYGRTVSVDEEQEKVALKDGASTVAVFRDREKDRSDPDYDRSYDRYARGFVPCHELNLGAFNVFQPSLLQYVPGFHQLGQFPRTQASMGYMPSNSMTPFSTSPDAVYMQWPTPAMVYAHSYDHFRHVIYPVSPVYQQPLSFEHWQNLQRT